MQLSDEELASGALLGAERLHDALSARNAEGGSALIDWLVDNAGDEWWDEVVGLAIDAQLPGSDKSAREPRDVLADRITKWAEDWHVYDYADRLIRDLDDAGFQIVCHKSDPFNAAALASAPTPTPQETG